MVISKSPDQIDAEITVERAKEFHANLALTRQFTAAILDDLSLGESTPLGATVYVLPDDDPERTAKNLAAASHASQVGHDVILWTTGGQMTRLQSLRPRWPARAEYVTLAVDFYAGEDVLRVRFSGLFR